MSHYPSSLSSPSKLWKKLLVRLQHYNETYFLALTFHVACALFYLELFRDRYWELHLKP